MQLQEKERNLGPVARVKVFGGCLSEDDVFGQFQAQQKERDEKEQGALARESALALGRDMRENLLKNSTANSGKFKWSGRLGRRPMFHGHLGAPTHGALPLQPLPGQLLLFHKPLLRHRLLCHCSPMIPSFKLSPCHPSYPHLSFLSRNWTIHIWIVLGPLCLICLWVVCLCCALYFQVLCNQVCLCHPCPWSLRCPCAPLDGSLGAFGTTPMVLDFNNMAPSLPLLY